jgi:outer membrane protein TolC
MAKLLNRPNLNFQASAGAKNGYIPDLNQMRPNYIIGIGFRMPIYDGMKTKYRVSQARSAITSISWETETAKRNISTEVIEAEANTNAAGKKVTQFELQLDQAIKANSLAETSFRSGTITNLDLLDANTSLSESRLMLLKAKIDYVVSIFRLKAALGIRLY